MSKINVFLQSEGIKDIVRLQLEPQTTALGVKQACPSTLGIRIDGDTGEPIKDPARLNWNGVIQSAILSDSGRNDSAYAARPGLAAIRVIS